MSQLYKIKHKDGGEDIVRIIGECYVTTLEKNKNLLKDLEQIFKNYELSNYNSYSGKKDMCYSKALELIKLLPSKEIWVYVEPVNNNMFDVKKCFYVKREWLKIETNEQLKNVIK